ncbi:CMGC/SRPK protein kinase [Trichophyton rubrum]|uniref:Mitochondrial import inner membrane translocase subunit TIM9 n=1 Tax=Trichophyton rubrum TaxID=5551 RepID=A0A178F1Y4_TRIRU|nr:CMGC/SRPK protein kinase [Trichophyton rubrum]
MLGRPFIVNSTVHLRLMGRVSYLSLLCVKFWWTQIISIDLTLYTPTKNLLLGIDDTSVFSVFEEAETDYQPCPRKVLDDRTIYVSRRVPFSSRLPIITDFGEVRLRDEAHIGEDIMPDVYRAPEIILRSERDIWVGIWSVAMVSWDIAKGRTLFKARNGEKLLDDRLHLAEMIAIMGPPPKELLGRSQTSLIYWDENVEEDDASSICLTQNEQQMLSKRMEQKQMKEVMNAYSNVVQRCFEDCIFDFTTKSLTPREVGCTNRCFDKFVKASERVTLRFQEQNAAMAQSGTIPGRG